MGLRLLPYGVCANSGECWKFDWIVGHSAGVRDLRSVVGNTKEKWKRTAVWLLSLSLPMTVGMDHEKLSFCRSNSLE
jgi:hypothetical protein